MSNCCCPTDIKPVTNNYEGVGKMITLDDGLEMYVTGSADSKQAIVNIYDIFGMSSNTKQFADCLAEACQCMVIIPDIIGAGKAWPPSNVPPTKDGAFPPGVEPADGREVLVNWIMTHPTTVTDRSETLTIVKNHLVKEYGITKLGAVGMCWGSKVAWTSHKKASEPLFDALAACHGSFMEKSDVEGLSIPQCFLNSKDEPETYRTEIKPILLEMSVCASKNLVKDFPSMHHGWMGTRGVGSVNDFQVQEVADKFREGVSDLTNFFKNAFA